LDRVSPCAQGSDDGQSPPEVWNAPDPTMAEGTSISQPMRLKECVDAILRSGTPLRWWGFILGKDDLYLYIQIIYLFISLYSYMDIDIDIDTDKDMGIDR